MPKPKSTFSLNYKYSMFYTAHFLYKLSTLETGRFHVHCVWKYVEKDHYEKNSQHIYYTPLAFRRCKWNTRTHGWYEHTQRKVREMTEGLEGVTEVEEEVTSLRHHGWEQQAQSSPGVILRERGGEAAKKKTHGGNAGGKTPEPGFSVVSKSLLGSVITTEGEQRSKKHQDTLRIKWWRK